ncbi:hypothetical protein CULT_1830001 [[Clostridium] ultunense Esp]|nr:hypothetical protein CULT_1830001 [[Clostridium] ultunense Esp]
MLSTPFRADFYNITNFIYVVKKFLFLIFHFLQLASDSYLNIPSFLSFVNNFFNFNLGFHFYLTLIE